MKEGLGRRLFYLRHNLRDIYDSYLARPSKPGPTPLGFLFGGLGSQHHRAMEKGTFEPDEVRLLSALIAKVDGFVDVGANVGYYTCLARSLGKPAIAIEPMPNNLRALYENLRANGWEDSEVLPLGASDRAGIATLFGASSTGASLIDSWAGAPRMFQRSISISTLDLLLGHRFQGQRLLIKVDVEGNEYRTLAGAAGLLGRQLKPIWLVEITFHEYHPDGFNPQFASTFELLWQHGYAAHLLEAGALKPIDRADVARWAAAGRTDSPAINYLFVPPDAGDLPSGLLARPGV
jgi:FkbM family methyltransferase